MRRANVMRAGTAFVLASFILVTAANAGIIFTEPTGGLLFQSIHGVQASGALPLSIPLATRDEPTGPSTAFQWTAEADFGYSSNTSTLTVLPNMSESSTADPESGYGVNFAESTFSQVSTPQSSYMLVGAHGEIDGYVGIGSEVFFLLQVEAFAGNGGSFGGPEVFLRYDITTPGQYFIKFDQDSPWFFFPGANVFNFSTSLTADVTGTGSVHLDPGFGVASADTIPDPTATPEPPTLVLSSILFGMFGTAWVRKRLKRAAKST